MWKERTKQRYWIRMRMTGSVLALLLCLQALSWTGKAFASGGELETTTSQEKTKEENQTPEQIPEAWFDDAIFIGDSLTGMLLSYTLLNGGLGNATILYVSGISCYNIAVLGQQVPYMGVRHPLEDILKESGAKKLFLLLVINDVGNTQETLRKDWELLIDSIQKNCPDVELYIQCGTPVPEDVQVFTKANIDSYNEVLRQVCEEKNCIYVEVDRGMTDGDGYLKKDYARDYVHLNMEGCALWVENLRNPDCYIRPLSELDEKKTDAKD